MVKALSINCMPYLCNGTRFIPLSEPTLNSRFEIESPEKMRAATPMEGIVRKLKIDHPNWSEGGSRPECVMSRRNRCLSCSCRWWRLNIVSSSWLDSSSSVVCDDSSACATVICEVTIMSTTFPQLNFGPEFPDILESSQAFRCYHWLSLPENSEIIHRSLWYTLYLSKSPVSLRMGRLLGMVCLPSWYNFFCATVHQASTI